jgi:hypothetical protein
MMRNAGGRKCEVGALVREELLSPCLLNNFYDFTSKPPAFLLPTIAVGMKHCCVPWEHPAAEADMQATAAEVVENCNVLGKPDRMPIGDCDACQAV